MTCAGYNPPFGVGQLDGTKFAGFNCNTWSAARANTDDTCGKEVHSSAQVRLWTGDGIGGTNLAQVDYALRTHTSTDLDTRYRLPWADFTRMIDAGRSAILQGGYAPIADSRFDAGRGFRGNHSVLVMPGFIVMDPLADGRYGQAYKYKGEAYPRSLMRNFAGRLQLDPNIDRLLGDGLCYAAFTRDNEPAYHVSVRAGDYGVYTIGADGYITPAGARTAHTGGFSATSTAPRLYRWRGHTSQSLVRVLSGSHGDAALGSGKGQYIRSTWAKEG